MADSSRSSYLEDPLHAYSGLSLFSRTLKSNSSSLPSDYQSEDPQQTHTILESMPFEIREEHLEQAMAILDDSSEFLKKGSGTSAATEAPEMIPVPNKRERRQGLDRKRGHFSFNPTISQSPENKPTFDPRKYPKPEDYFAAYEVYENALRQWEKYKGTSVTDTHQNQPSRRPRRPGMPGRKRAPFTLTYTENCLSAINLEDSEKENPDPSELSLERNTAAHVTTAGRQVDDSTVDTDKNIDNLLTKLLACKGDELEGDGAVKLLEMGLDMKRIDTGKLTFPDISKMNLKASVSSPSNRRNPLSDIQNVLKGSNSVAARKNRQSPSSNPSEDQFLFTDRLPADKQPIEVDPVKDLNICYSPSNVDTLDVADLLKSSVHKSSDEDGSDTDSGIHIFHRSPEGSQNNDVGDSIRSRNSATLVENADIQTNGDEGEVAMSESDDINEKTDQLDSEVENPSREVARKDLFTLEDDSIPYQQGESPKSPEQYNTTDECFEQAEHIQEQHGHENNNTDTASGVQVESAQELHNSSPERTNKRRSRESCDNNREKRSKTVGDESEGDKQMEALPHESEAEKQTKTKSKERVEKKKQMKTVTRESKMFSRRTSLADAGTKWESGIRRSTRIRSRPLEFWKGERFLYGRIHESLTTVIGIKYASPDGKSGKGELKVKSYVSDDYKKMVDFAALH